VDIKKDICKSISMQTTCFQIWQLAHRAHIHCANLITSSVSSVVTMIISKEIDIEMRNRIGKIKRIFEKPEHNYKLRGHFLD
jgi:hypothetical protein